MGLEQVRREVVGKLLSKGMATNEIAALLEISLPEVRRLAKIAAE
jgi:predicted transcriptional regulator